MAAELPHHKQEQLCTSRPSYRNPRQDKAVKVYTINQESKYLLVINVPSLGVIKELLELFSLHGEIEEYRLLDEYPCEEYTDVYLVKYRNIDSARHAKKALDNYYFYSKNLHVCYGPEYESVDDVRDKLEKRRQYVLQKTKGIHQPCPPPLLPHPFEPRPLLSAPPTGSLLPTPGPSMSHYNVPNVQPMSCFTAPNVPPMSRYTAPNVPPMSHSMVPHIAAFNVPLMSRQIAPNVPPMSHQMSSQRHTLPRPPPLLPSPLSFPPPLLPTPVISTSNSVPILSTTIPGSVSNYHSVRERRKRNIHVPNVQNNDMTSHIAEEGNEATTNQQLPLTGHPSIDSTITAVRVKMTQVFHTTEVPPSNVVKKRKRI